MVSRAYIPPFGSNANFLDQLASKGRREGYSMNAAPVCMHHWGQGAACLGLASPYDER